MKVLQHVLLTLDGIKVLRKIVQHVVIYAREYHSENRRYQQYQCRDQNDNAGFYNRFSKLHFLNHS